MTVDFLSDMIRLSPRRYTANAVFLVTMGRNLLVLMMAVCICGSYKNQIDHPAPFQGNLAMDEAESKYSRKPTIPHYIRSYGNIVTDTALQPSDNLKDLEIKKLNNKPDFRKFEIDRNTDLLLAAERFLDKEDAKEAIMTTIPSWACNSSYGKFEDLKIATLACTLDDECVSIVDQGCDTIGPFQACGRQGININGTLSTCKDSSANTEGHKTVTKISQYNGTSRRIIIDDSHFRFSGSLHGIDWKKTAKSSIPNLNDAKINYVMSIAGAVSLNPLILITSIIVDDTLSQSSTTIDDKRFFQAVNDLAEKLIRSHLEKEPHPKYDHAFASIWKAFHHRNEKVEEFAREYNDLYSRNELNFDAPSKYDKRDVAMIDLNKTMQWPWPQGECWEFSATHGGAIEGLPRYIPAAIDMAPSLYLDWFQNFDYLGSPGSVHASHSGILKTHSTCNVEITQGIYSTYYAHIEILAGLKTGDEIKQGDMIGHIERRADEALCLCDWSSRAFSCSTGPHLHWEVRRDGIPISIDNLRVGGIQIRAGKYERDATCTDPEHCLLAIRGGTNCATSFVDQHHNVYCPSVRGNTGGNFNYGRDPGWRIPMRPIFNPQPTTITPNATSTPNSVKQYFVGDRGGTCKEGSIIMDKIDCLLACDMLNIVTGTLRNNYECYRAGNGKCRQDGRYNRRNRKISPICQIDVHENPTQGSSYFKGGKGHRNCEDQGGLNILDESECKTACEQLEIKIEKLKNNKVCYVAGNDKCRQTGRAGSRASMVCKRKDAYGSRSMENSIGLLPLERLVPSRATSSECAVGGNLKCNPNTWDKYGGYRDGCCTPEQRCAENEGDCTDDSDCLPGLVCGSKNCPKAVGFADRADCCEPFSDIFKPTYGYKELLNRQCDDNKYGHFSDIKDAKQSCKEDKNCSAIYDVGCGNGSTYYLCPDREDTLHDSDVSCIHEKIIVDPCKAVKCGENAICKVFFATGKAFCACPYLMVGDPYDKCDGEKGVPTVLVTIELQAKVATFKISWEILGTDCKSSPNFSIYTGNRLYTRNCALSIGQSYTLKCEGGWTKNDISNYLVIENSKYCESTQLLNTVNITITGEPVKQCPVNYPYSFNYGSACCFYEQDYDGNAISFRSSTCFRSTYRSCPEDRCLDNTDSLACALTGEMYDQFNHTCSCGTSNCCGAPFDEYILTENTYCDPYMSTNWRSFGEAKNECISNPTCARFFNGCDGGYFYCTDQATVRDSSCYTLHTLLSTETGLIANRECSGRFDTCTENQCKCGTNDRCLYPLICWFGQCVEVCNMITVRNANRGNCNGLYRHQKNLTVEWAPLKPVYKHLTKDRYVFWASWDEYLPPGYMQSEHRSEWVIGDEKDLSPDAYGYMSNSYPRSGLRITWPWQEVWESGTIVTCA